MSATQGVSKQTASVASDISPDELRECAHLLALSVVQHRAKFGAIPLANSVPAHNTLRTVDEHGLHDEASAAFDEALQLVRRQTPLTKPEAARVAAVTAALSEHRRELRVSVTTPVQISNLVGTQTHRATLRNISWSGASVTAAEDFASEGARVCLHLPVGRTEQIAIIATVLRAQALGDGREYGLRFDSLSFEAQERLQKVLEILIATPQDDVRRSEARIVQRLEIEYGDAGELRASLEDISTSGLMLIVPDPLEINQSLLIELSSVDTPLSLKLRARVMHQALVPGADCEWYRVGLQFEHSTLELTARIRLVLRELAILRPAAAGSPEAKEVAA